MRSALQTIAVVYGLVAAGLSLLGGMLVLVVGLSSDETPLVTVAASIGMAGGLLGIGMALAGLGGLQGRPSPVLRLPAFWVLLLAFVALVILGEFLRQTDAAGVLLSPLHVVVSILPPLTIIALVEAPLRRAGVVLLRRDLIWQVSFGALGATLLAGALETFSLLGAGLVSGLLLLVLPGGQATVERLNTVLEQGVMLQDPQAMLAVLLSPALLMAVLLFVSVVTPLIEEVAKSLGVVLTAAARHRLGPAQAFALGVMAGTGFSFAEALFYGAMELPEGWAGPVLVRSSTAAVHGLATGLIGLACYALLVRRSRVGSGLLALASVGVHGAWNAAGGLLLLAGINTVQGGVGPLQPTSILAVLAVLLQVLLFLLVLALLVGIDHLLAANARRDLAPGMAP